MCFVAGFDCGVRDWGDVSAIATLFGVVTIFLGLAQLRHQSDVARSTFENLFVQQYHQLVQRLPPAALLGGELTNEQRAQHLGEFYHYIDLCNTQAYHHTNGRISDKTWDEWSDGITWNLARPELKLVWAYIAHKSPDGFSDLRGVVPPDEFMTENPYSKL